MRDKIDHLALYLDAPLQAWGYQSKFDRRTTLSFPTRSGILGMLCAAMGVDRAETAALGELRALEMTVITLQQQGRLVDFHTVGGGWNKKVHPGNIVRKADGKVGTTVLTQREYLESARFGAILSGNDEMIERVSAALCNPRWGIWLGRKACVPASPVYQGVFGSVDEAAAALEKVVANEGRVATGAKTRVVTEVARFEDGTDTLMDVPLDFSKREFAPRRICVEAAKGE